MVSEHVCLLQDILMMDDSNVCDIRFILTQLPDIFSGFNTRRNMLYNHTK
jgi:hypothetical protein